MYLHTWNPSVYTHFLFDRSCIRCTRNRKFVVLVCKIWQWYHSMNHFYNITWNHYTTFYRKMLPYFRRPRQKLPTKHSKLICWILESVHKHKNSSRKNHCVVLWLLFTYSRVLNLHLFCTEIDEHVYVSSTRWPAC